MKQLEVINKRIDEAIQNEPDQKMVIEALICMCESQNNNSAVFTTMSIAYAVIIGGCSVLFSGADNTI